MGCLRNIEAFGVVLVRGFSKIVDRTGGRIRQPYMRGIGGYGRPPVLSIESDVDRDLVAALCLIES